jgi:hypothetical protein
MHNAVCIACETAEMPESRRLQLVIPHQRIRKLFDTTGLDRVFTVHRAQSEALGTSSKD